MPNNDNTEFLVLLARVDERTKQMESDVQSIKRSLESLKTEVEDKYVRKEQFSPIQRAVFSVITLIVMAVVGALVGQVIVK